MEDDGTAGLRHHTSAPVHAAPAGSTLVPFDRLLERVHGSHSVGPRDGVVFAFFLAGIYAFGAAQRFARRRNRKGESGKSRNRTERSRADSRRVPLKNSLVSIFAYQLVPAILLWSLYRAGGWTFASVGVSPTASPVGACVFGLVCYFAFIYGRSVMIGARGTVLAHMRAGLRANASVIPASPGERLPAILIICVLNPFTEELIFRGLLVYQFSIEFVPVWVAIVIGGVVNAINHSYQGRTLALDHVAFYAASVALLYSPAGLIGAIGFHLAGDVLPFLWTRSALIAYRNARRAERRKKAPPPVRMD